LSPPSANADLSNGSLGEDSCVYKLTADYRCPRDRHESPASSTMRLHTLPLVLVPTITLAFTSSKIAETSCNPYKNSTSSNNTYDYIVTGSGPGGGTIAVNLARAGHSVLLIEAGSNAISDIRTQVLSLNEFSNTNASWHFFVKHSDDEERTKRYNLLVWRLQDGDCKWFLWILGYDDC